MSEEQKTADGQAENGQQVNTDGSAVDNNQQPAKTKEQIAQELSEKFKDLEPSELFEKIAEEMAKKEEIIGHKNRAIESLKKPKATEAAPASNKSENLSVEEIVKKVTEEVTQQVTSKMSSENFTNRVKAITSDENQQKAILDAYQNGIVKTGDVEADLKKAIAIANADNVLEILQNTAEAGTREATLAAFSAGRGSGTQAGKAQSLTAKQLAVAENLRTLKYSEEQIQKAIANIK